MKGFLGVIIIIFSYIFLGIMYNSSFFETINIAIYVIYIVMFLLTITNAIMANQLNYQIYLFWLGLSIIPGNLFMTYARFDEGTGGFISFPWDWVLWEIIIPFIYIISQIICLIKIRSSFNKLRTEEV